MDEQSTIGNPYSEFGSSAEQGKWTLHLKIVQASANIDPYFRTDEMDVRRTLGASEKGE